MKQSWKALAGLCAGKAGRAVIGALMFLLQVSIPMAMTEALASNPIHRVELWK